MSAVKKHNLCGDLDFVGEGGRETHITGRHL